MSQCPACGKVFPGHKSIGSHVRKCSVSSEDLFWSKIDKNGPNGCWIWTAGKDRCGYGCFRLRGEHNQAHRLAWKLLRGDPGELLCLHTCHNPACCNPDHIHLGTDADNAQDKVQAGRSTRGEKNHTARLTADQVLEIRSLRGKLKQKDVASKYGISLSYVFQIWCRHTWRHLAP